MPELPEVEIMCRNVRRWTLERRVDRVVCLRPRTFREEGSEARELAGGSIARVLRRGKVMWLESDTGTGWLVRFGMTGKWVRSGRGDGALSRYARAVVELDDGSRLVFEDRRNLGSIRVWRDVDGVALLRTAVPGIDPFEDGLSGADLAERVRGRRIPIKALLLDQSLVSGIGNIYSSEVLFRACLNPWRPAGSLTARECARLAREIRGVLAWAIGAFDADEIALQGEAGVGDLFAVYRRAGKPCLRCGTAIEREVIGGRAAFHCPRCQPRMEAP